jgi:hypothetical protein
MQIVFDDLIGKNILIYLDDLIVYLKTREDYFDHLKQVFLCCRKYVIESYKIIFCVTIGKLLGHIISDSCINIDLERVVSNQNIQAPSSKK